MDPAKQRVRAPAILAPGEGRRYPMGRMHAVFKADLQQTESNYSISEWWLEPDTTGPGVHQHPEDHVFYVIEGELSVFLEGAWTTAKRGSYILIPGNTPHDFQNRSTSVAGFMSINVPGGFEEKLPGIVEWFAENPPGRVTSP